MDDLPRPAEKTVDVTVTEGAFCPRGRRRTGEALTDRLTPLPSPALVCSDGSKVVAQTPNGSRVETPVQAAEANAEAGPSRGAEGGARGSSYATALKTSPTDWHLEFSMNGKPLPLDMTVYGAVHRHESTTGITNGVQRGIWSGIYPIAFKKVAGPAPTGGASFPPFGLTRARGFPLTSKPLLAASKTPTRRPSLRRETRPRRRPCPTLFRPTRPRPRSCGSCASCTRSTPTPGRRASCRRRSSARRRSSTTS
jgi:hypothetical protein